MELTITKEEIAELPQAEFTGRVIVIDNPVDCRKALRYLMTQERLGFDTETRPSFKRGEHHKVALLQVSTLDECFLFRLNRIGLTPEIIALFESPDIMKIGLSIKDDMHQMHSLGDFDPQNMVELQSHVKQYAITDNSLQKVYAIIFSERISKGQRLTNWEADTLSESQCGYAALDAYACLRIYNHLEAGGFDPAGSPYQLSSDTSINA